MWSVMGVPRGLLLLLIFAGSTSGKPSDILSSWVRHYDTYFIVYIYCPLKKIYMKSFIKMNLLAKIPSNFFLNKFKIKDFIWHY